MAGAAGVKLGELRLRCSGTVGGGHGAWRSTLSWGWGHCGCQWVSPVPPVLAQEISECCAAIQTEAVALSPALGPLLVLPLHPGVGRATQRLYETPEESRERRVIVTHWLGDSSFSLGTVRFVIDSGLELRSVSGTGHGWGSGAQWAVGSSLP